MATYQILYWNEFPAQVRAEEGTDEVLIELAPRFQDRIDVISTDRGITGSDEYLDGWKWSDSKDRDGSAQDVADAVKRELENNFPEA